MTAPKVRVLQETPPHEPIDGSVDAWLNLLMRLTHLPHSRAVAIREELAEHLHERIRDLNLEGYSTLEASRVAIAELGDAAAVAARFRHAARPSTRRIVMNSAIAILALTGATLGIVAVSNQPSPSQPHGTVYTPQPAMIAVDPSVEGLSAQNEPLAEILRMLDERLPDHEFVVDWPSIVEAGLSDGAPVSLSVTRRATLSQVMARVETQAPGLDWRITADTVHVSSQRAFDAKEAVLVTFDIAEIITHVRDVEDKTYTDAVSAITALLFNSVEPEAWRDNGGDIAHLHVVGGKLFIQAPPRFQQPIAWILAELRPQELAAANPARAELNSQANQPAVGGGGAGGAGSQGGGAGGNGGSGGGAGGAGGSGGGAGGQAR